MSEKVGTLSVAGGQWSVLDPMNPEIQSAVDKVSSEYGLSVPPNLVKAIVYREGSGGRDFGVTANLRNDRIHAFTGIFDGVAREWGLDPDRGITDRPYAFYMVAKGLAIISAYEYKGKRTLAGWGWAGVAGTYFSGKPDGSFTDELGNTTDSYLIGGSGGVITNLLALDRVSGGPETDNVTGGSSSVGLLDKLKLIAAKTILGGASIASGPGEIMQGIIRDYTERFTKTFLPRFMLFIVGLILLFTALRRIV